MDQRNTQVPFDRGRSTESNPTAVGSAAAPAVWEVFYDASCPLCRAEIDVLAAADVGGILAFVDCSPADFEHPAALAAGIDRTALMTLLHARHATGGWLVGAEAFEALYRAVGIESVARLWGHPWLKPWWSRVYPWIARHRQTLSKLGFAALFEVWVRHAARRAHARRCQSGHCN